MKKLRYRHGMAMVLALLLVINACLGYIHPSMESFAYTARTATVRASSLNVRSGPGTTYSAVAKLSQGTAVTVIEEQKASDGVLWYQIRFSGSGGAEATGYARHDFIKFPVEYATSADFEAYLNAQGFPESYKPGLRQLHAQYPSWVFTAQHTNLDWNTVIKNESILPRSLVHTNSVSSWKSIADGAYNWDSSTWPGFDGSSWVAASEDIVRYYMDPRNFLDETYVFQFLRQSYDSSAHTAAGLESMVKGTFMDRKVSADTSGNSSDTPSSGPESGSITDGNSGNTGSTGGPGTNGENTGNTGNTGGDDVRLEGPSASVSKNESDRVATAIGPGMTGGPGAGSGNSGSNSGSGGAPLSGSTSYVDIIMNAGAQSGVNPYVLAAMIIQEQGSGGTSPLISGSYSGYEGYYNFFNVETYQSGSMNAMQRGLWYASQSGSYGRPWNSVEKSILGGSLFYGENYVKAGQNTFYLKKFNVQGSNLYKHQYMTNVQGAASEGAIYAKAYSAELKNTALEFQIPIFQNMPDNACSKPATDGSPNNKLGTLGVNGFALTPTFGKDTVSYDLIVDTSVSEVTVNATALNSSATISGTGNVNLQSGNNEIKISVKAQNGTVRDYIIHVVRQENGPKNDGSIHNGNTGTGNSGTGAGSNTGPGASNPGNAGNNNSGNETSGNTGSGYGPGGSNVTIVQ